MSTKHGSLPTLASIKGSIATMWTCPKCGEAIENRFDSCWKCSPLPDRGATSARTRLRLSDYLTTATMAYAIPWLGVCLQSTMVHWRNAELHGGIKHLAFLWMLVPAAINFLILLPFVKFPVISRLIAGVLVFGWTYFLVFASQGIK
jgi:hypothetical protein